MCLDYYILPDYAMFITFNLKIEPALPIASHEGHVGQSGVKRDRVLRPATDRLVVGGGDEPMLERPTQNVGEIKLVADPILDRVGMQISRKRTNDRRDELRKLTGFHLLVLVGHGFLLA